MSPRMFPGLCVMVSMQLLWPYLKYGLVDFVNFLQAGRYWPRNHTLRRNSSLQCISSSKPVIQLRNNSSTVTEVKIYSGVGYLFWECTYNKSLADSHFLSRIRVFFKSPWQRIQNCQNLNNLQHSWCQALQMEPYIKFLCSTVQKSQPFPEPDFVKEMILHAHTRPVTMLFPLPAIDFSVGWYCVSMEAGIIYIEEKTQTLCKNVIWLEIKNILIRKTTKVTLKSCFNS